MAEWVRNSVEGASDLSDIPLSAVALGLPEVATIKGVETAVEDIHNKYGQVDDLVVDLGNCTFVEVTSLVYLTALIAARERSGLITSIVLPRSKSVRDFMRVWRFPEALRAAIGRPFYQIVREEDRDYFGENIDYQDLKYAGVRLLGGLERLVSEKFFALIHLPLDSERSRISLVKNESARWEQRLIMAVLDKYLSGPKGYISSRVIYESMTNSVRHPNAAFIQTASHIGLASESGRGTFTIVFWDDGDSIIQTLRTALAVNGSIRSSGAPSIKKGFLMRLRRYGKKEEQLVLTTDFLPEPHIEDDCLLLSSVFPGITRDPFGRSHVVHDELKSDLELNRPGMGLFVLINAVVDVFGGSVAFRTDRYFMNIKRSNAKVAEGVEISYQAKIEELSPSLPKFLGNLITVRIPVKSGA